MDDETGAPHSPRPKPGPGGGGDPDHISALPDDLLLHVVELLGSADAVARTSTISRRWRGLWARLPKVTVALHDVPLGSLPAALRPAARPGLCHYHLDITAPRQQDGELPSSSVSELLLAAATLEPVELRLALPLNQQASGLDGDLPGFRRATSIDLRAVHLRLRLAQPWCLGGFPSLETLSLYGCDVDLAALLPRCPRLRVLRVNGNGLVDMGKLTIHSASLQELLVEGSNDWTSRIDVDAPALKHLEITFHARDDLRVSVSAPMVEKVVWQCSYITPIYKMGLWGLLAIGLNAMWARLQLPHGNVLSLHMLCAQGPFYNSDAEFAAEIYEHMVTSFSGLDLHLRTMGHVFGAFVLHLLRMRRVRTALQRLKIVLLRPEVKDACSENCLCDDNDWRTETISLADLENMEIEGVGGEDHELDFFKVIFRCAPMLKRVTVRLSDGVTPSVDWCTKINNIFMAYPSVECNADLVSRAKAVH